MIRSLSDEDRSLLDKWSIGPLPVLDYEGEERNPLLIEVGRSSARAEMAERFGFIAKREMNWDFTPFYAGEIKDRSKSVYLINSQKLSISVPAAVGALGVETLGDGRNVLRWCWIHPWERGTGLWSLAWRDLESEYGTLYIEGPTSPAMDAFMTRNSISRDRVVRIS